jgi:hypothetical protein
VRSLSFLSPGRLWLLLAVAGLVAAYLLAQRRRSKYAVRFTNLALLDKVAPRRPGWRRHLPAAAFLLMLGLLTVGFARPTAEVQVPRERATVMVAIVLMSDGSNTSGRSPEVAARAATAAGVPVSTIAYGTAEGSVTIDGQILRVPADTDSLRALADNTGGQAYEAASGEELGQVYDDIGSSIGTRTERQEVSVWFIGAGLAAAAVAAAFSLAWFSRLP